MVKNLARAGCFDWVVALFAPVPGGYVSIRFKPTSPLLDEIAEICAAMLAEEERRLASGATEEAAMERGEARGRIGAAAPEVGLSHPVDFSRRGDAAPVLAFGAEPGERGVVGDAVDEGGRPAFAEKRRRRPPEREHDLLHEIAAVIARGKRVHDAIEEGEVIAHPARETFLLGVGVHDVCCRVRSSLRQKLTRGIEVSTD